MLYYKSPYYIQKGYGLGGIFRGIAKVFYPFLRNTNKILKSPVVRKAAQAITSEVAQTGAEILTDSLRGNNVKETLPSKIERVKTRIADTIEESLLKRQKRNNTRKYQRMNNIISDSSSSDEGGYPPWVSKKQPKSMGEKVTLVKRGKKV